MPFTVDADLCSLSIYPTFAQTECDLVFGLLQDINYLVTTGSLDSLENSFY